MKKLFVLLVGMMMLFVQQGFSQLRLVEDFSVVPPAGWMPSSPSIYWRGDVVNYVSAPRAYCGRVPSQAGGVTILESRSYYLANYTHVLLRFKHICKISPSDTVWIEIGYQQGGGVYGAWKPLPSGSEYKGAATNYKTTGFNAASYTDWNAANNLATPTSSWWKPEEFDLKNEAGQQDVKFRFVIKHGNVSGTDAAYGWLIDDFEVLAANAQIIPPTVEFISPFVKDTVFSTGPWEINAKVKTNTNVPIATPWLKWTTSTGITDSIQMTKVKPDSLWKAEIPQFPAGTSVSYFITGMDTVKNTLNTASISSGYFIKLTCGGSNGWTSKNYSYTGSPVAEPLQAGTYEIEMWGADGGSCTSAVAAGGKGGYSKGTLTVSAAATYYVCVGGKGLSAASGTNIRVAGGYNGGGGSGYGNSTTQNVGSGGGATHIATAGGLLSTLSSNQSAVKIVAGGGGGAGGATTAINGTTYNQIGGHGGGLTGVDGGLTATSRLGGKGGTQSAGGAGGTGYAQTVASGAGLFGIGGDGGCASDNSWIAGGGGGGYYGGGGGNAGGAGGGGGSGYIGGSGVTNGVTAQSGASGFVTNPDPNGNGYVKITLIASMGGCDTNSVALHAINILDTTATSPTYPTPISLTIKNKGVNDLDSVRVSYSINGTTLKDSLIKFNPALKWDMNATVVLGTHIFPPNGTETLKAFVYLPNGVLDKIRTDDTITKKIYGSTDLRAEWVVFPYDTMFITGPYQLAAEIISVTGKTVSNVKLHLKKTNGAVVTYDSLNMNYIGDDLWVGMPTNVRFGTKIEYTLRVYDYVNNSVELKGTSLVVKQCGRIGGNGGGIQPSIASTLCDYTGSAKPITLKKGTYEIECWGANGGGGYYNQNDYGKGGYSKITYTVTSPTTTIYVYVGGKGATKTVTTSSVLAGGWNGGGNSGYTYAGSGGGGTDVRTSQNTTYADRIIVAGGGGAAGYYNGSNGYDRGGNGGGVVGEDGYMNQAPGGTYGGRGGTQIAGGAAGNGGNAGTLGIGGAGPTSNYGGGGGGGYYGGGGGGSYCGGGGGSGYIGGAAGITAQPTDPGFVANPDVSGNGYVKITLAGKIATLTGNGAASSGGGGGGNQVVGTPQNYTYKGSAESVLLQPGTYKLECWGAQGGTAGSYTEGGRGGYSVGTIMLTSSSTVYVYVGGAGSSGANVPGGFNGGGLGYSSNSRTMASGGGASDIRIGSNSLYARVIVAGGGGGGYETGVQGDGSTRAFGGGLTGGDGTSPNTGRWGYGGTQTAGGAAATGTNSWGGTIYAGSFGVGGYSSGAGYSNGGGSGWYGGGASIPDGGGGGGSGYVYTSSTASNYPAGCLLNSSYYLASASTTAGSQSFTSPSGASEIGHKSNGHVRITCTALVAQDCDDTNSVALESHNLEKVMTANAPVQIKGVIRNMGLGDLTSCNYGWKLNGQNMNTGTYTKNPGVADGFIDTITFGTYTPQTGCTDNIVLWVSMPNGKIDSVVYDDTLRIDILGCGGPVSGVVAVGNGTRIPTIEAAFDYLKTCGVGGNVTFELNGTFTENVNLTTLSTLMGNNHLTITSQGNNPDNAVIRASGTAGVILGGTKNFTLKAVTVDAKSNMATYAIQFTAACKDIVIRDCKLLHDIATTSSSYYVVYKGSSTGIDTNISFINNRMEGAYYGIYYYGGTGTSAYGRNIVFDSNTVIDQYNYATYFYYVNFASISYNKVTSRTVTTTWYGINGTYFNGPIVGNSVIYRGTTSTIYLLRPYYYHYGTNGGNVAGTYGLIANNELIANSTGAPQFGIHCNYMTASIINNSIYLLGSSGDAYGGIYLIDNAVVDIRNNDIIVANPGGYPISQKITGLNVNTDYNNLYGLGYVGYAKNTIACATIQQWQILYPSDKNSVSKQPSYIDVATMKQSLRQASYLGMTCQRDPLVLTDINGVARGTTTSMGCHAVLNNDATLVNILGMRKYGVAVSEKDSVFVELQNVGLNPIANASICWRINGVTQGMGTQWYGNMAAGGKVKIYLGQITYQMGNNVVEAYLCGAPDQNQLNDTAKYNTNVCPAPISGDITVGMGKQYPTMDAAFSSFVECGVGGDVRFLLASGVYTANWDFTNNTWNGIDFGALMGGYTLTIASETGNRNDVRVEPTSGTASLTLSNTTNLTFENITFGRYATAPSYAVNVAGPCTNIVIRNCNLLMDTTTTSGYYPLYKASGYTVDNFRLVGCTLDGGYYGASFSGASNMVGFINTNVVFDSNTFIRNYLYGVSSSYTYFTSISNNSVISRVANNTSYWYGMSISSSHIENIIGNRVRLRTAVSTAYSYGSGIALSSINSVAIPDRKTFICANNEVILTNPTAGSTIYGIQFSTVGMAGNPTNYIINNAVYTGQGTTTGTTYGMYFSVPTGQMNVVKNNILHTIGGTTTGNTYPIYLGTAFNTSLYDIDYNDYYSATNIGYAGAARTDLTAWRGVVATDLNSVKVLPTYANLADGLKMTSGAGLTGNRLIQAVTDIESKPRALTTTMGCYEMQTPMSLNASLTDISGLRSGSILGQSDIVKVEVVNSGTTTINAINLGWSVNGTSYTITYNGTLNAGQTAIINLSPQLLYTGGSVNVKVWINSVNGTSDNYRPDDTTTKSTFVCAPMAGDYTVGAGKQFATIEAAFNTMISCGVAGDIRLLLASTTYTTAWNFTNNMWNNSINYGAVMGGYMLTIASETGNRNDVKVLASYPVTLNNTRNLTFENITFGQNSTATQYAVYFTGGCKNITIRNCNLLTDTATTSTSYNPLYKGSSTGIVDSFRMVGCLLDGGYYGAYFYGITNAVGCLNTNISWDSNTFRNAYYYAMYTPYTYFTSVSHNTFLSRVGNSTTYWHGLYLTSCHAENVIGNSVRQRMTTSTYGHGIYLTSVNTIAIPGRKNLVVANNEVFIKGPTSTTATSGIYFTTVGMAGNPTNYIINNSVHVAQGTSTGATYGIYMTGVPTGTPYQMNVVKNNMIHTVGTTSNTTVYPIYLGTAFNANYYNIDANNMYAPTNIGYTTNAKTNMGDWQLAVTTDKTSQKISPSYVNNAINLKLNNYTNLTGPRQAPVYTDFEGTMRGTTTSWGCYHDQTLPPISGADAALMNIVGLKQRKLPTQQDALTVELQNTRATTITNATIELTVNGVSTNVPWSGTLLAGEKKTVPLGNIIYQSGTNTVVAVLKGLGSLTDADITNDTAKASMYVCSGTYSGTYTINMNTGGQRDFTSIAAFMTALDSCGAVGDIRLELNGTFTEGINATNLASKMNGYHLTVTSLRNHRDSVKINASQCLMLGGTSNLTVEAITLGRYTQNTYSYSVYGSGAPCKNITIQNCNILNDTLGQSGYYTIYMPIQVEGFTLVNNLVAGEYYCVSISGAANAVGGLSTDIVFDSNIFINGYLYAVQASNCYFKSISHNTFISRRVNNTSYWQGLNMSSSHAENIIGNRIIQRTPASTAYNYGQGIYLSSVNSIAIPGRTKPLVVANNEIIITGPNAADRTHGIYFTTVGLSGGPNTYVVNNSVYISLGTGAGGSSATSASDGMYFTGIPSGMTTVIKNNIIHAAGSGNNDYLYPIYLGTAFNTSTYDIDNNIMYSPTNVGYAGAARTTLNDWQSTVTTDKNSINAAPSYVDATTGLKSNLKLTTGAGLTGNRYAQALSDIDYKFRAAVTTIGCYEMETAPIVLNASLTSISGLKSGSTVGQTDVIKLEITNAGSVSISTVDYGWSFNGVSYTGTYNGTLNAGQATTITLTPSIIYPAGGVTVKAWINNVNTTTDDSQADDTISIATFVCAPMAGDYTVGAGKQFATLDVAFSTLVNCGVVGDIRLLMGTGSYATAWNFTNNMWNNSINYGAAMKGYKLTIASETGNRNDVKVLASYPVTLNNTRDITFENITFGQYSTSTQYPVYITGPCKNITIRNCNLLTDTATTSTSYNPLQKGSGFAGVDSFRMVGCLLEGGYYGANFYGGANVLGALNTNIVWDSNTFRNGYQYAMYAPYNYFTSLSHNTFISRVANNTTNWYGLYLSSSHAENVIGNRVRQRMPATAYSYGYGAILSSVNTFYIPNRKPLIFANNEVMMQGPSAGNITYGIQFSTVGYAGNLPNYILHNSVYVNSGAGTAGGYGIYFNVPTGQMNIVKNNISHITHNVAASYPIYLATAFDASMYDIDYNDMLAPQNVGYAGAARASISAWQSIVASDKNSVSVQPIYVDTNIGLDLTSQSLNDPFLRAPFIQQVTRDIDNKYRIPMGTTMGAFERPLPDLDLMAVQVLPTETGVVNGQIVDVSLEVSNAGNDIVTDAVIGWSVNGQTQTSVPYHFPSGLAVFGTESITLGQFTVSGSISQYNVKAWIETVNNTPDMVRDNDTALVVTHKQGTLAKFIAPFVQPTTDAASFDVHVYIFEGTGAPIAAPPYLVYRAELGNCWQVFDSVAMVPQGDGKWLAAIPPTLYMGSKVEYSLHVEDNIGNIADLMDSTYIGYSLYAGNHLSLASFVSPQNIDAPTCTANNTVDVIVNMTNLGTSNQNFATDAANIICEVTDPKGVVHNDILQVQSGNLLPGATAAYTAMRNLQTPLPGLYTIKVWVESQKDDFHCDDTISFVYISGKVNLPIIEDFNAAEMPTEFYTASEINDKKWSLYQLDTNVIKPNTDMGVIRFLSADGDAAWLNTRSFDLYNVVNPTLEFWYYHDAIFDDSYLEVYACVDGVKPYIQIASIPKGRTTPGWAYYNFPLTNYTNSHCVSILFYAMNQNWNGTQNMAQYIDRVVIDAYKDLALTEVILPTMQVCDFNNKDIKVVMRNASTLGIDFEKMPTSINLKVNSQNYTAVINAGILEPYASDTIVMTTMNFVPGTNYDFQAWIADPIDKNQVNDTTRKVSIFIDPDVAIAITPTTKANIPADCVPVGYEIFQYDTVYNLSQNFDLYNIPIQVEIQDDKGATVTILYDTIPYILKNSFVVHKFKTPYYVPKSPSGYTVIADAVLACDYKQSNNTYITIQECVDMNDISVLEIVSPNNPQPPCDTIGDDMVLEVKLYNESPDYKTYNVTVNAVISDGVGNPQNLSGSVSMQPNKPTTYKFTSTYKVPDANSYTINVFVTNIDQYSSNDTLPNVVTRCAVKRPDDGVPIFSNTGFALGQNVPNPAKENTRIDYNVPQDGDVIFTIYTITGQALFVEKREARSGNNEFEFNTENLANGIYYYSMEYKGERLVKKMTIRK